MEDENNKLKEFYEDVGDPLADFRKKNRGGRINKGEKCPFDKDPDVIQAQRQQKLVEQIRNTDVFGLFNW